MTDEVLRDMEQRAEAFPAYAETHTMCSSRRVWRVVDGVGAEFLGGADAWFSRAEAEFLTQARGDILALAAEVRRLRDEMPK